MQYGKFRSCCGPRIIDSFFQFDASSSSTSLLQVSLLAESTSRSDCTSIPASGNQFANTSQDSDCERPSKAVSKKQSVYTHFPQDRNFEICKRINITALCRKRTGEAVPRVKKIGDFGTRFGNSMDTTLSGQNQNSQETEKSLRKFLEPSKKSKVIFLTFFGIWQSFWRVIFESLSIYASPIRTKWCCWKSGTLK